MFTSLCLNYYWFKLIILPFRAGGFAVVAVFRLQYLVKARTRSHLFEVKTLQQALMSS